MIHWRLELAVPSLHRGPFDADHPAADIYELIDFLENSQQQDHYFRGQTQFYDHCAPSALRPLIKAGAAHGDWLWLDKQNTGSRFPARMRARADFRSILLMVFQRGVGNLLCQQYGISSDGFDITFDPRMAGFFATRAYPDYMPLPARADGSLGVIYRFTIKTKTPPPLSEINRHMGALYLLDEGSGNKLWFNKVESLRARVLDGAFSKPEDIDAFLLEKFPEGHTTVDLYRASTYMKYEFIEKIFVEQCEAMKVTGAMEMMQSSRTFRQRGGMYFPPSMHTAFCPREIHMDSLQHGDNFVDNITLQSLGAHKVYNLNANPYVERFFFRHDNAKQVEIDDVGLLWPGPEDDKLLELLSAVCESESRRYLDDYKCTVMDFDNGIIDPGYKRLAGARPL